MYKEPTRLLLCVTLMLLCACDLSPEMKLPDIAMPSLFKEDVAQETATVEPATDGKWKRLDDKAQIEEFAWWRMFKDANLDALMERAMKDNPSLEAALARVEAARGLADNRAADLYPAISVGVGPERTRPSAAAQEPNLPAGTPPNTKPYTLYTARGIITYDLDLFGRNRNRAKAADEDAKAQASDYRAARLSLQAELAQTYFRLSALKKEEALLKRTLATREESLKLTKAKVDVGASDSLALSSAEAELATVQADAEQVRDARARAENALAAMVAVAPSELKTEFSELKATPPSVPVGMPSSLLERRPDIQRAGEAMAAANARIGVARTGYFPEISLSAAGGLVAGDLGELFKWSSRTWTIGPMAGTMLTQPIFEGGRIAAAKAEADGNFKAAVADYRTAVLQAFREVEDQLSGLQSANTRMKAAQNGLAAATRAHKVAGERYKVGYSSHLEYLEAERSKLAAERAHIQVRGDQYISTIQLVRALGGSWQRPAVPESTGEVAKPGKAAAMPQLVEPAKALPVAPAAPVEPVKEGPEASAPDNESAKEAESLLEINWLPEFTLPSLMQDESAAEPASPAPSVAVEEEKLPPAELPEKSSAAPTEDLPKTDAPLFDWEWVPSL